MKTTPNISKMDSEELAHHYDEGNQVAVAQEINRRPEYYGGVFVELRDRYDYTAGALSAFEGRVKAWRKP